MGEGSRAVITLCMTERHYNRPVQTWLPIPGTTTGKLVEAALTAFGERGYDAVGVTDIATMAGVTTGALYHHFGSKARLWNLVRTDVEQRVLDRIEGAAAATRVEQVSDLGPALLVAFDYLRRVGYLRLLAEPAVAEPDAEVGPDRVAAMIDSLLPRSEAPVGALVSAAWRESLRQAAVDPDGPVRAGLERLLA
jgi:AcrR family transcriptional regulator